MKKWKAPPPPRRKRKRAQASGPHMYNISAKWEAEKAGRNGLAPNADDIDLVDPARIRSAKPPPQQIPPIATEVHKVTNDALPAQATKEEQPGDTPRMLMTCWGWKQGDCPVPNVVHFFTRS
jgi:hypothetical protein